MASSFSRFVASLRAESRTIFLVYHKMILLTSVHSKFKKSRSDKRSRLRKLHVKTILIFPITEHDILHFLNYHFKEIIYHFIHDKNFHLS